MPTTRYPVNPDTIVELNGHAVRASTIAIYDPSALTATGQILIGATQQIQLPNGGWIDAGVAGGQPVTTPDNSESSAAQVTASAQQQQQEATTAANQQSAKATLKDTLDSFGLGSLTDWGYGEVAAGKSSQEILQDLRQTDQYKQRFQANVIRQKNGLDPLPESTILSLENSYSQLSRQYGLPAELYSTPEHFAQAIAGDVSPVEYEQRLRDGYDQVAQNPATAAAFRQMYGVDGDTALAMYFMDSERALPLLMRQEQAGTLGGVASKFGLSLTRDRAEQLIQGGATVANAPSAFASLTKIAPVFDETVTEHKDLTAQGEGLDSVFNQGGTGATDIQRRLDERQAAMGGGGGALLGQAGTGLGTSSS